MDELFVMGMNVSPDDNVHAWEKEQSAGISGPGDQVSLSILYSSVDRTAFQPEWIPPTAMITFPSPNVVKTMKKRNSGKRCASTQRGCGQTDRQADRQTDGQTDSHRQTDR